MEHTEIKIICKKLFIGLCSFLIGAGIMVLGVYLSGHYTGIENKLPEGTVDVTCSTVLWTIIVMFMYCVCVIAFFFYDILTTILKGWIYRE